jgi:chorismate dehydratase
MTTTVGSVPYANALPLVARFELDPNSRVRVIYDVPSRLPQLLESGDASAILVSSVDALRVPGRRMAAGVCIGSDGPVKSVRLFSKVPFYQIGSLALDQSSMTSNRLAQVLLAEIAGVRPMCAPEPPDQERMLAKYDACVLIGDIGMLAPSEGLHVLDMGEAWTRLTGLPFVWAAWIGGDGLSADLAGKLRESARQSGVGKTHPDSDRAAKLFEFAKGKVDWPEGMLEDYFQNVMVYEMGERALDGLREFQRLLLKHGFDDCVHFPEIVG